MSDAAEPEKQTAPVAESAVPSAVAEIAVKGKPVEDNPSDAKQGIDLKNLSDAELVRYLQQQALAKQQARFLRMALKGKDTEKEHKFWNTQPVLQLKEEVDQKENSAIDTKTTLADIRQEPLNMPAGFVWKDFDITDPKEAEEVYCLLRDNYVEDDDCTFRFDYSIPFLQWALCPPGYRKDWHVGVRSAKTGALMGIITSIPVHTRVYDKTLPMAEINFLCVHKKLRSKRLAPVLIKEITRRVNLTDVWQAVYTAGVVLPKPVGRCRYWHRSLNPKKLIEARFSSLPPKTTMQSHLKNLKLPARVSNPRLRPMAPQDVPAVHKLLNAHLDATANLALVFSEEDIAHTLLPRPGVIDSYVVEADDGSITDLGSFYHLPSSIIGNDKHNKLSAVYSYYQVARTVTLVELMRDLMVLARDQGADVFNALDLMQNSSIFEELKFGSGDGFLQYYLYNWKCAAMESAKVGIVLV